MQKRLADCQRVIGYWFADPQLLEIALTHSSVRTPDRECNERQEFLGDSVLGLAITEELYKRLPDQQEGELTRIKSAVVSRGALYRVSMRLGLPRFIEIAKGVGRRDEMPVSLTANLVESIIGAIYLDAGFFPAREFILRHLGPELEDTLNDRVPRNYKSLLQHEGQHLLGATPIYRTIEEEGPDHRKSFTVACILKGTEYGRASGINKKEAEQEAARHALEALTSRGRGGRRRRGRDGDRDGGREGGRDGGRGDGREAGRSAPHLSPEEEAWRQWAEKQAAAGASVDGRPAIGPESDEAYLEPHAHHASPDTGAMPSTDGAAGPGPTRALAPEFDDTAPPSSGAAGSSGQDPAGRTPSDDDDRRGRRRRRGGRGRGRGRRDEAEPAREGAPASDAAPSAEPEPSDGAPPPPFERVEPVEPVAAVESEAPREGGRGRRGARGRFQRDAAPPASESDLPAPAPAPAPVPAPAPRGRGRRPEPAPAAASGTGFGEGVVAEGGAPVPTRRIEKAVTPLGGIAAVKKAPKNEPPPATGGFGSGL